MKRVGRVLVAVCVGSSLLAGGVFGQSIPPQLKTSPSIDKASAQAIELAVTTNVKKLADANPDAQRQAREALIGEVRAAGAEPSAAFMAAYSEALGNAVMKLPKDVDVRALLNAAIVVARVAEITKSPKLEPVILWLLGENQPEAIKLWGMKAARGIMPELARQNLHKKLLAQVVPTVKAHPTGAMTAEAYEALLLSDAATMNELLNLVALRASLYQGPAAPEDPNVDYTPFPFLSVKGWAALQQPQRVRVLQLICSLMVLGARHGDAAEVNTLEKDQLTTLVQSVAKALEAIALQLGNQQLRNVASNASRAVPMEPAAKEVCPAIRQIKGFEAVQEPSMNAGGEAPATPAGNGAAPGTGTGTGTGTGGGTTPPVR